MQPTCGACGGKLDAYVETGCYKWIRTELCPRGVLGHVQAHTLYTERHTFPGNGKSLAIFLTGRDGLGLHWEPLLPVPCVVFWGGGFSLQPDLTILGIVGFIQILRVLLPTRPARAIPSAWRKRVWAEGTNYVGVLACWNVLALGLMQWIPISHCRLCKPICFPGSTYNQS